MKLNKARWLKIVTIQLSEIKYSVKQTMREHTQGVNCKDVYVKTSERQSS